MARTQPPKHSILQLIPWPAGKNLSQSPALIANTESVVNENTVTESRESLLPREGLNLNWDTVTADNDKPLWGHDYWFTTGFSKSHKMVTVTEAGKVYAYTFAGDRTDISDGPVSATYADMLTFGNFLLIAITATNTNESKFKIWNGVDATCDDLVDNDNFNEDDQLPPKCSILQEFEGRVVCNDLERKDRLHFSETFNPFKWNGSGDSRVLDIGQGDGDPDGIVAIFPAFKGQLFVAKRTKLYRVFYNAALDTYGQEEVSSIIGCESHHAVAAVDTDDVYWISQKGIHRLSATDSYGDFESSYVSYKVQPEFNERVERANLQAAVARYVPELNSVFYALTTDGESNNNELWVHNIEKDRWSTWPSIDAVCMVAVQDSDARRLYLGRTDGRFTKTQTRIYVDENADGSFSPYNMRVKTGIILPQQSPTLMTAFKKVGLYYQPLDTHSITLNFRVDNYPAQSRVFSNEAGIDVLGTDFEIDTSLLGRSAVGGQYLLTVDGHGRGCEIELIQTIDREYVIIDGLLIEWAPIGPKQEFTGGIS